MPREKKYLTLIHETHESSQAYDVGDNDSFGVVPSDGRVRTHDFQDRANQGQERWHLRVDRKEGYREPGWNRDQNRDPKDGEAVRRGQTKQLLPSAYSHRLTLPISQRSPQPFYRAKLESPQPPHAQRDLDEKDDNCEEQAKRGSDLAEKGESITIEDRGADERLKQIIAQRHASDRRKWRQAPPPGLTLRQQNDG